MLHYLINSTLCAALLYATYFFVLEKENMHNFKRVYLLVSLVVSLTVPLVTTNIELFHEQIIETDLYNIEYSNLTFDIPTTTQAPAYTINYKQIIFIVYALITSFLLLRLIRNFTKMILFAKRNKSINYGKLKIILLSEKLVPHSFLNYIFVNADDYHNGKINNSVLIHETTHVQQKHTLDVIFTEFLIAFFWFNPILYLYKSKIKQNHEFIADKAATGNNTDIKQYQMLLINSISQQANIRLASNFNYLITKKRLIMMTKTTSKLAGICRQIAIIPVFFAAICIFSSKSIAHNVPEILPQQESENVVSDLTKYETKIFESNDNSIKGQEPQSIRTVDIKIMDRYGQEVYSYSGDSKTMQKWDGKNNHGISCGSGTYFYVRTLNKGLPDEKTDTSYVTFAIDEEQSNETVVKIKEVKNVNTTVQNANTDENVPSQNKYPEFQGIAIQKVFTTNGDGQNDVFKFIEGQEYTMKTIRIRVFDRWGNDVYSYNGDYKTWEGWNGKNNDGVECADGTYFYLVNGLGWNDASLDGKQYTGFISFKRN